MLKELDPQGIVALREVGTDLGPYWQYIQPGALDDAARMSERFQCHRRILFRQFKSHSHCRHARRDGHIVKKVPALLAELQAGGA